MVDQDGESSFFQDIYVTNGWRLDFRKTYNHRYWTAATSRRVDSLEINQEATGDIITFKSREIRNNAINSFKQELWPSN